MDVMSCPGCGTPSTGTARFCMTCGHALPPVPPPAPTESRGPAALVAGLSIALAVVAVGVVAAVLLAGRGDTPQPRIAAVTSASPANTVTVVTVVQKQPSRSSSSGSSTRVNAGRLPSLRAYATRSYSLQVPSTWQTVSDDADQGAYRESKWQSPTGDGSLLVDYTVGFSGTPQSGAAEVRSSTSRSSGYQELGWRSWAGGWRWDFIVGGQRKMDVFFTACGTGYALLGTASPSRFSTLEPLFEQAARSLEPQC
jgi:hypothetical protein